jgi:hypothetical protein
MTTVPGFLSYIDAAGNPVGSRTPVSITTDELGNMAVDPASMCPVDALTADGWGVFSEDGVRLAGGRFRSVVELGDSVTLPTPLNTISRW